MTRVRLSIATFVMGVAGFGLTACGGDATTATSAPRDASTSRIGAVFASEASAPAPGPSTNAGKSAPSAGTPAFPSAAPVDPGALSSAAAVFGGPTAPAGTAVPVPAGFPIPSGSTVQWSVRTPAGPQLISVRLTSGRAGLTFWSTQLPAVGFTGIQRTGSAGAGTIGFTGHGYGSGTGLAVSSGIATIRLAPA